MLGMKPLTILLAGLIGGAPLPAARAQGRPPAPPPQALKACVGQAPGAACQVEGPDGQSHAGTCWAPRSTMRLACVPADAPPPPPGR